MAEIIGLKNRAEGIWVAGSTAFQALRNESAAIFEALIPTSTPVPHAQKAGTNPRILLAGDRLDRILGGPAR